MSVMEGTAAVTFHEKTFETQYLPFFGQRKGLPSSVLYRVRVMIGL